MPKPCAVYRIYNAADELLYVGVTGTGQRRHLDHYRRQSWATEIHRTEWEHFPDRPSALARERQLIAERAPRENISQGATPGNGKTLLRMDPELHTELAAVARRQGISLNLLCVALLAGGIGFRLDDGHDPTS